MAPNVFGFPITDATLRAMPEYDDDEAITPLDRACEAFRVKNAQNKHALALEYVRKIKAEYGYTGVPTMCVFYNAIGGPVKFLTDHDWEGYHWKSPYPKEVANGQWGAFLHVHSTGHMTGSSAAVAYVGTGADGKRYEWSISWSKPWDAICTRKLYVEAQGAGCGLWSGLKAQIEKGNLKWGEDWQGCLSEASITDTAPVVIEAVFTLSGADR